MAKVEIYTTMLCPYCIRAKKILRSKGVKFIEIRVDFDSAKREEMTQRAKGGYTVPQIFINDNGIGGCDDLVALNQSGKLDELLAE